MVSFLQCTHKTQRIPMKRSNSLFAAMFFLAFATFLPAQSKFSISAGTGLLPTFPADQASVNMRPVNVRLSFQATPAFSIGAYAGYSSYTTTSPMLHSDGLPLKLTNQQTLIGLRAECKKAVGLRWAVYGGALLGYNHTNLREFDPATNKTVVRPQDSPTMFNPNAPEGKLFYSAFVGTTFNVYKSFGLFTEIGYGVSLLNAGVTFRF